MMKMDMEVDEPTSTHVAEKQKRKQRKELQMKKKKTLSIDQFGSDSEMIDLSSLSKKSKKKNQKNKDESSSTSVKLKKKKKKDEKNTTNCNEASSDEERVPIKTEKIKDNDAEPERLPLPHETRVSRDKRTIFVGNVPLKATKRKMKKLFEQFGDIEKIWLRGAAVGEGSIPKKVAIMKKLFSKNQPGLIAYILYADECSPVKAQQMNGELFMDHHLRVDMAYNKSAKETDMSKSVFLGNLPFTVTDEEIWDMFNECGEIASVRIVRDSNTGIGKGFGYVNFKNSESIELALKLNEEKLNGREIRVKRCIKEKKHKISKLEKKEKKGEKKRKELTSGDGSKKKTIKYKGKTTSPGSIVKKKKKKVTKGDLEKKVLAEKLKPKIKKNEN